MKKFASKLEINNKILWIDHCSNPENLYKQFDLITLASIYGEGFPNVLAEAMACGVPCVATDVGDSKIIVSKYGKTIPIKDPKALSDAWLNLVSNNSYLPQDLWKHIDTNFSLDALQNKMNIILKELITNNE